MSVRPVYTCGQHQTTQEALRWFRAAAAQGEEHACFNLGLFHEHGWGGLRRSNRLAAQYYLQAAKRRHAGARFNLGDMFWRGIGVPRNRARAMQWWRRAARDGEVHACMRVGIAYGDGHGVRRDMGEARKWLLKALRLDEPRAFRWLARLAVRHPGRWAGAEEAYLWLYAARQLGASYVRSSHLKAHAARLPHAREKALQARAADRFDRMDVEFIRL